MKNNVMKKAVKKWQGVVLVLAVFALFGAFNKAQADNVQNGTVNATAIQSDGKIIIGGCFTSYGDTIARDGIARFNLDGTIDESFAPGTGANGCVNAIAIQLDGKIVIGGAFTIYNGQTANHIARLNTDGSLDTTFNSGTGTDSDVRAIAIQADGKIIIGGSFGTYDGTTYDGNSKQRAVRLNIDGTMDTTFAAGIAVWSSVVNTIAIQPDGKIIIGGNFSIWRSDLGRSFNHIARINANGSLDQDFSYQASGSIKVGYVNAIAVRSDGKIIIGGGLPPYNTDRINILNADGNLDSTFASDLGDKSVNTVAIQPDGKIVIGGAFTNYNGTPASHIARLNIDGSLDDTFNPGIGANSDIRTMALQPNGKIVVGGSFTSYSGTNLGGLARLQSDGQLDQSPVFEPFYDISVDPWKCASSYENDSGATKENLVVITHGWNASASSKWLTDMRDHIEGHSDATKTAVRLFDWQADAGTLLPTSAYDNAEQGAICLYHQIMALNPMPKHIHFIAHSAGANIIQTAVDLLASKYPNGGGPSVQLTFLDAYVPLTLNGERNNEEVARFGDLHGLSGYSDNYVDMRDTGLDTVDGTKNLFGSITKNFDVTKLDPSFIYGIAAGQWVLHHEWPIHVYDDSINDPLYDMGDYTYNDSNCSTIAQLHGAMGFPLSAEAILNLSAANSNNVTSTTAKLNFTSSKDGTYYYLVYPYEENAPDSSTIKAQGVAVAKGTSAMLSGANTIKVGGLTPETAYKAYVFLEDGFGNQSDVSMISFTTNTVLSSGQVAPDENGNVTLTMDTPEAVITDSQQAVTINAGSLNDATVNYSALASDGKATLPQTTIDSDNANIEIPAGTTVISSDSSWNGVMSAPTETTVDLPQGTLSKAVSIGLSDAKLTFDKAVRVLLYGEAGMKVGYIRNGEPFTEITTICSSDSQSAGDALPDGGDCKINVGKDLVVWTKHFTTFATYSQEAIADTTAPVIIPHVSPDPNSSGWNNSDVTVSWDVSDSESAVSSKTGCDSTTINTETDGIVLTCAATSEGGNSSQSVTIKLDKTAPEITTDVPAKGYILNSQANADWTLTDNLSGVDGDTHGTRTVDTSSVGSKSFTVTAIDKAGNSDTKTVKYDVVYAFGGFQSPAAKDSKAFNISSTIPVKFQLTDASGGYVSNAIASLKIDEKEAVASGGSNDGNKFKYDASANQYIFNLSVKNTSLGVGKHTLNITLDDGTTYSLPITIK